jgi:excisionase family DNA binding protein
MTDTLTKKLNKKEVGERLGIPLKTIDYLVASGQIPYSRVGKRSVRFDPARIQAWFIEREGVEYRLPRKDHATA